MTRGAAVDAGDRPSDDRGEVPETPPGSGGGRGRVSSRRGKAGETSAGRYREDDRRRCVVDDEEDAVPAGVKSTPMIGNCKGGEGGVGTGKR